MSTSDQVGAPYTGLGLANYGKVNKPGESVANKESVSGVLLQLEPGPAHRGRHL